MIQKNFQTFSEFHSASNTYAHRMICCGKKKKVAQEHSLKRLNCYLARFGTGQQHEHTIALFSGANRLSQKHILLQKRKQFDLSMVIHLHFSLGVPKKQIIRKQLQDCCYALVAICCLLFTCKLLLGKVQLLLFTSNQTTEQFLLSCPRLISQEYFLRESFFRVLFTSAFSKRRNFGMNEIKGNNLALILRQCLHNKQFQKNMWKNT